LEDYQAFYHLAAANQAESDRLYTTTLTAPKEWLEMAISDLNNFLHLFPDHSQAQQVIPNQTVLATISPHPKSLSRGERDFESCSLLPGEKGWG
jgi:hypothetical protein